MIGTLIFLCILVTALALGATADGSPTEVFYAKLINAFYGSNHTGRPVECGRDWTYFHYIATESGIILIIQIIHVVFSVTAFVKLWRRGGKSLNV